MGAAVVDRMRLAGTDRSPETTGGAGRSGSSAAGSFCVAGGGTGWTGWDAVNGFSSEVAVTGLPARAADSGGGPNSEPFSARIAVFDRIVAKPTARHADSNQPFIFSPRSPGWRPTAPSTKRDHPLTPDYQQVSLAAQAFCLSCLFTGLAARATNLVRNPDQTGSLLSISSDQPLQPVQITAKKDRNRVFGSTKR